MSNISKLLNSKNKSLRVFADTITTFAQSQGFYGRLCRDIDEMEKDEFDMLKADIKEQKFSKTLDVVFWLEC